MRALGRGRGEAGLHGRAESETLAAAAPHPHSERRTGLRGGLGKRPGRGPGGEAGCPQCGSSPEALFLDLRERGGWRRPGAPGL